MNSTIAQSSSNVAEAPSNGQSNTLTPLANILETGDGYLLEAEMPGVSREGLDVSVENGQLFIQGRRGEQDRSGTAIYRESRQWDYRRVFELDPSIDATKITARMEQGVLRLHLPTAESVKPRKIVVTD